MELSNKPFIHLFRTRNQYYFYDANTCSIIRINETMYDILKNKENFLELEQLKKLYENGFLQSKEDIIIICIVGQRMWCVLDYTVENPY